MIDKIIKLFNNIYSGKCNLKALSCPLYNDFAYNILINREIAFHLYRKDKYIHISTPLGDTCINLSDIDLARLQLEFVKVKQFSENCVEEVLDNFINTSDVKKTNINDLDI